ncbi:hypothetical protein HPB50_020070 [Hyalomma asiaticum]|uniref:Uncharacterized protein n=1 Tax=Hyalomma asiaticum TaxID=266040 RepID=A0ACB7S9Y2_HYAAI|nr:hypothetical protein HPB50_020070 [Hyalomma asiaticum]
MASLRQSPTTSVQLRLARVRKITATLRRRTEAGKRLAQLYLSSTHNSRRSTENVSGHDEPVPDGGLTAIDREREAKGIARRSSRLEQYDTQNSRLEVVARFFASLSSGGADVVVWQQLAATRSRRGNGQQRSSIDCLGASVVPTVAVSLLSALKIASLPRCGPSMKRGPRFEPSARYFRYLTFERVVTST